MFDWLDGPWGNFVAVFLGAALGAALTVWLTNRSQRRRAVDAAFASLQSRIVSMFMTGFRTAFGLDGIVALGQDVSTIGWQSPQAKKIRRKTAAFWTAYGALMDATQDGSITVDHVLELFAAHDRLGEALYGKKFVPLDVLDEEKRAEIRERVEAVRQTRAQEEE